VTIPSHAYDYAGEAVVGRRLKEVKVGVYAGQRLDGLLDGVFVEAGYGYTFVERVLDVPNNRSNGSTVIGFALPRGWSTRAIASWQRTHGGLRFPDEVTVPAIPERLTEFSPHAARQLSSHRRRRDLFAWDAGTLRHRRSLPREDRIPHDIHVFSVTAGRVFEIGR
jgi:hypothetical protein